VLRTHQDVDGATVMCRKDSPGSRRLIAYLTPNGSGRPATGRLRRQLTSTLPHYVIPAAYVTLERIALTAHGKIDHAALPAPPSGTDETASPSGPKPEPAPDDETQFTQRARAGWKSTLGVADSDSTLFGLGGSSLHVPRSTRRSSNSWTFPGGTSRISSPIRRCGTTGLMSTVIRSRSISHTLTLG
jgi:hypothetical protein